MERRTSPRKGGAPGPGDLPGPRGLRNRGGLPGLARSFAHAVCGVARSIPAERNLRIHLTAVCYVTAAGWLAGLRAEQWGLVLLCFGGVIAAELFNTALERLCDALHPQRHPLVGAAKDAAAGAVLVLALASVGVAIVVFGPWVVAGGIQAACRALPWLPAAFVASLAAAAAFIFLPGRGREPG